ncbi:MAG: hypothetical protein ACRDYB_12795 [Acidimicrobiales bacterium]
MGVYSNPRHVVEYADGEVRQQFSVCFACRLGGGTASTGQESSEVAFFAPEQLDELPMHESIRLRIRDYLRSDAEAVIA